MININNVRLNAINNKNEENCRKRYLEIMDLWDTFKSLHMKCPELRMGQLLSIFMDWYHTTYGKDIFYVEDEILSLHFEEFVTFLGKEED